MTKQRGVLVLVLVAGVTGGISVAVSGQTRSGGAPARDELLEEIRGLRGDLAQAMSANIRAQLLVGRLQLQEQRMNTLGAQLAEVRRGLAAVDEERSDKSDSIVRFQGALEGGELPARQQEELRAMIGQLKAELSRGSPRQDQLRDEESQLSAQLVAEQGRWMFFNDSLDAIEASLPDRQSPAPQR